MMGRRSATQGSFFYSFNLVEIVPRSHLLRRIDPFVTEALTCTRNSLRSMATSGGLRSILS